MKAAALLVTLIHAAEPIYLPPETACMAQIKGVLFGAQTRAPYLLETETHMSGSSSFAQRRAIPGHALHETMGDASGILREYVVVDGRGWTFFDGQWSEITRQQAATLLDGASGGHVSGALENIADASCAGATTHDGRTVHSYTYTLHSEGWNVDVALLADAKTDLPIEQVVVAQSDRTNVVTTSSYSYDQEITITPPLQ